MSIDPAFANVGKQPGLQAWRIENLKPVAVPSNQINKLYSGDSYIFLKTTKQNSALSWNIHFWLGKDTSADESGVAAYKTVELDDALGGGPVQYRECQGHESELFLSYFKATGLEYLHGGVASGFTKVERDVYETRLFQLKGKRTVRVTQVPLKNTSLSCDDVYVLDAGLQLFVFNGTKANRMEKAKGLEFVRKLCNEDRGGRASITILDDEPKNSDFWSALGGFMEITREAGSDEAHDKLMRTKTTLLRVSDASNRLEITDVTPSNGILKRELLQSDDVFIVDTGDSIHIWVGKNASESERKNAMVCATKYLQQTKKSMHTPVTRVVEGAECPVFKAHFYQWEPPKTLAFGRQPSSGIATSASQKTLDVQALAATNAQEDEMAFDANAQHDVTIWRIENMEKVQVPSHLYGHFYGGDSYVVLHTMASPSKKPSHVIYYWQGRTSTQDEKAAAALWATRLDEEMGGSPVQVRVIQGKEPAHFRALFNGKMIVHSGGKASGFTNVQDQDSYDTDGVSLYHVKGTTASNTMASQVEELAANLNSGDCFVLVTPKTVFEWHGANASPSERSIANSIAVLLQQKRPEHVVVVEGEESEDFWAFLGGKTAYASDKSAFECAHAPRLFHCSNAYGYFDAHEIHGFAQDDLISDDVFLLDTYTSIYLWIGTNANEDEKRQVVKLADDYLNATTDGRSDASTPVIMVHCGHEPLMFTSNFLAWDPTFFDQMAFQDPYEERLRQLQQEKQKNQPKDAMGTITSDSIRHLQASSPPPAPIASTNQTFSYEQLVNGVDGIDITAREAYLSDAEFETVFSMSKSAFASLPKWKQQAKKKEVNLF